MQLPVRGSISLVSATEKWNEDFRVKSAVVCTEGVLRHWRDVLSREFLREASDYQGGLDTRVESMQSVRLPRPCQHSPRLECFESIDVPRRQIGRTVVGQRHAQAVAAGGNAPLEVVAGPMRNSTGAMQDATIAFAAIAQPGFASPIRSRIRRRSRRDWCSSPCRSTS